jgi:probable rRNA maturation factor
MAEQLRCTLISRINQRDFWIMDHNIIFHVESGVEHPFPDEEVKIIEWLKNVAHSENRQIVQLNFIFCDDEYLLDINIRYLAHDYYTDIITFPYQEGQLLEGDMFISLERVRDNASEFNTTFDEELRRVMVHGMLHLMGYADKSETDQQHMREKENYYLQFGLN